MRKIKYTLIVSDFDGTLVKKDGTISQHTRECIRQYIADGGVFAISTGRMPMGILQRVKELGLTGVVCCGQGSAIVDIATNEVILEGNIPNQIAVQICEKMEQMGLHIHVYTLWDYYSNMDDEYLKMYESIVGADAIIVQDKLMSQFVKEQGFCPGKVLAMLPPNDNERVRLLLQNENFAGCDVTRSSASLIEVSNASYSKGTSIEFLAEKYHIPVDKTIAIGDQINDLSMIQRAGLGVAVKNADAYLKEHAVTCPYTNEEDAVAWVIENYGYEEEV